MPSPAPVKARPAVVAAAVLLVVLVCGTGAFGLVSEVVTNTVERTNAFTTATDRLVVDADGDVTASRLSGPLTVDRLSGDITAADATGPLDLRSRTGEITGESLHSEVIRAASATGDVRLELVTPPRTVDITSDVGEVDLAVPADTTYRVDATTRVGEERVLVPLDAASTRSLRVEGNTGDVTVRPSR